MTFTTGGRSTVGRSLDNVTTKSGEIMRTLPEAGGGIEPQQLVYILVVIEKKIEYNKS